MKGIVRKIQGLADNPRPAGVVKLSGEQQLYRLRHGDFRIIYEIRDDEVLVIIVKVGHRRDVYK